MSHRLSRLTAASTSTNDDLNDLVADLNSILPASVTATLREESGFGPRIDLSLNAGTDLAIDSVNEVASKELGFISDTFNINRTNFINTSATSVLASDLVFDIQIRTVRTNGITITAASVYHFVGSRHGD